MCLLHWLKERREEYGFSLLAAHYEHGLRGDESLRDAAFTREQCEMLGIRIVVGKGDVAAFAEAQKLGIEDAARTLRYRFLEETADRLACDRIATAHNLNDNAETVLMNLCRGAGTRGLAGIPPVRGRIVRPLLWTSREEIETYLDVHRIPHIEDSSNRSDDYTRNRIRHQIIPLLMEENPSFLSAIGRTAELLREDDACLCREAEALRPRGQHGTDAGSSALCRGDGTRHSGDPGAEDPPPARTALFQRKKLTACSKLYSSIVKTIVVRLISRALRAGKENYDRRH